MLTRADFTANQQTAVQWGTAHENCAIWMPMGHGKTGATATVYADLLHAFATRRALIIAPLRVARRVWDAELLQWAHLEHLSVSKIIGTSPAERMLGLRTAADVHTINRENLQWLAAQFIQNGKQTVRWPWDLVIADEAQSFNSQSSKRWKALDLLRPLFPRLIELSGTPIPNGYHGLWAPIYLLDRGKRLGTSESAFLERWFDPPRQGGFAKHTLKGEWAKREIEDRIKDIVLSFENTDPPIPMNFIRVPLPAAALKTYRQMERKYIAEVAGKTLTAVNAGVLDGKLLQLANGAVYTGEGREWVEFHGEKVAALEETLEGIPGKCLIAYYYRHDLQRIEKVLNRLQCRWRVLQSDADFEALARGEVDRGVVHPASCGHGLNDVHKAGVRDLVHFGLTNNLELFDQVNARIRGGHRGKGFEVMVHILVADQTRDEDYVDLLRTKSRDQDGLMQALSRRGRDASG